MRTPCSVQLQNVLLFSASGLLSELLWPTKERKARARHRNKQKVSPPYQYCKVRQCDVARHPRCAADLCSTFLDEYTKHQYVILLIKEDTAYDSCLCGLASSESCLHCPFQWRPINSLITSAACCTFILSSPFQTILPLCINDHMCSVCQILASII